MKKSTIILSLIVISIAFVSIGFLNFQKSHPNSINTHASLTGNINFTTEGIADVWAPNVTILSPENNNATLEGNVLFRFNVSEDSVIIHNCTLILNGISNSTIYNLQGGSFAYRIISGVGSNFTIQLGSGNYLWSVNCTDQSGNSGNSSTRNLTLIAIELPATSAAGTSEERGTGGKTTNFKTHYPTESELTRGYSQPLGLQDRYEFNLEGRVYQVILNEIGSNKIQLLINSPEKEPIPLTIPLGETKKIDINGDGISDLFLTLIGLQDGKAIVSIKTVAKTISSEGTISEIVTSPESANETQEKMYFLIIIALLILITLIAILIIINYLRGKGNNKRSPSKALYPIE